MNTNTLIANFKNRDFKTSVQCDMCTIFILQKKNKNDRYLTLSHSKGVFSISQVFVIQNRRF